MLAKASKLGWYWRRLRAMSPAEVALRLQKKAYQRADAHYKPPAQMPLIPAVSLLPARTGAPELLLRRLAADAEKILRGEWKAFGHLPMTVGTPPRWHWDNVLGKDNYSARVAFQVDHRAQPNGADIKVIWEPNRWYQLVRLAMAAWLLGDAAAREKCIEWLHDWARANPPFTGLNWTSGLETGIRLIQFAWIDSMLVEAGVPKKTLDELRNQILPPHVSYTWRYKSFGSSANNHLIGELAGLIVAVARWPELAHLSAPLPEIAALWEREVLLQFAEDGGNNEQALGYHLFSWEFCWQAEQWLKRAGVAVSELVSARIAAAAEFYRSVKASGDPWDFGDSDNAWVTPFFADEGSAAREWWQWFDKPDSSPALNSWWRKAAAQNATRENGWRVFRDSGYAVFENADWFIRMDASPLGYLSMAPHGHLDVLHVSVSYHGTPLIIDPGTGCYYADKKVRAYLAGWTAHNSLQPKNPVPDFPKRYGIFLWGSHHAVPSLACRPGAPTGRSREGTESEETPREGTGPTNTVVAELTLPWGKITRSVSFLPSTNSIRIIDVWAPASSTKNFGIITRWKFAPGLSLAESGNSVRVSSAAGPVLLTPGRAWTNRKLYNPPADLARKITPEISGLSGAPLEAIVSPAFRALAAAPFMTLESDHAGPFELMISPG